MALQPLTTTTGQKTTSATEFGSKVHTNYASCTCIYTIEQIRMGRLIAHSAQGLC